MISDKDYKELLFKLPKDVVKNFIIPLANKDPLVHKQIVAFLILLYEKGFCIIKNNSQ